MIKELTLKNGLKALLIPREAESVAVGVFITSGSRHETAATAGISHFIEHMLFKGTPTRKPLDITRAIEGAAVISTPARPRREPVITRILPVNI